MEYFTLQSDRQGFFAALPVPHGNRTRRMSSIMPRLEKRSLQVSDPANGAGPYIRPGGHRNGLTICSCVLNVILWSGFPIKFSDL
jgi:hypothetical protein